MFNRARILILEGEVKRITAENVALLEQLTIVREARDSYAKQANDLGAITAERDKLRKNVRAQTGADLLVNALQELGVFPSPTPPVDHFKEDNRLSGMLNHNIQTGMKQFSNRSQNSRHAKHELRVRRTVNKHPIK